MQTVTQSQFFTQTFNPNLYSPFGGAQQPQNSRIGGFNNGFNGGFNNGFNTGFSRGANNGFNNGFNASRPMSQMAGNFSRASYTVSGQTTSNGQTSSYYAKTTITNRGPGAGQMQPGFGNIGNQGPFAHTQHAYPGSQVPQMPPTQHGNCDRSGRTNQSQWTDTGVSNNKASIDLGDYKLDFSKSNSSMLLTDKKTGDQTNIYGDPHLEQHANSGKKTSDMFNGTMTFQLPDSTKVTVGTQPAKNNASISFADNVTITKGNQAYQVSGLSQQSSAPLTVQKSNNGRALDAATPDGYTVVANRNGSGFVDPATGKQPTATDLKKAG
ncbi:DUF1521 domain-containing protein [Paraburkholderia sp. D15]|uniref:DUF1521 domain-containing protein n=1 Tax=Paraburkholderia sp. D15 TaxID=2880218 RepID=UPI0024793C06|nr:DUF1521 domain-containing protein [Paraburkholderia sp. D15]WGS51095.1 DUF1521 domain-containing protein [Paraburkholderia sp. D15]